MIFLQTFEVGLIIITEYRLLLGAMHNNLLHHILTADIILYHRECSL